MRFFDYLKIFALVGVLGIGTASLTGCEQRDGEVEEGIEDAGEAVEEGTEEAGEAIEEGAEEVEDGVEEMTE